MKTDKEKAREERRQEIINSINKENGENTYLIYLDVENKGPLQDSVKANSPEEALSAAYLRAISLGIKAIKEECRAKDTKTGKLYSFDGEVE